MRLFQYCNSAPGPTSSASRRTCSLSVNTSSICRCHTDSNSSICFTISPLPPSRSIHSCYVYAKCGISDRLSATLPHSWSLSDWLNISSKVLFLHLVAPTSLRTACVLITFLLPSSPLSERRRYCVNWRSQTLQTLIKLTYLLVNYLCEMKTFYVTLLPCVSYSTYLQLCSQLLYANCPTDRRIQSPLERDGCSCCPLHQEDCVKTHSATPETPTPSHRVLTTLNPNSVQQQAYQV